MAERDSGRLLDLKELSGEEWALVVYWDRLEKAYEIAHQKRIANLFEMLTSQAT